MFKDCENLHQNFTYVRKPMITSLNTRSLVQYDDNVELFRRIPPEVFEIVKKKMSFMNY